MRLFYFFSLIIFFCSSCFMSICTAEPIGQHFILTLPYTNNFQQLSTWLEQTKPAGVMLQTFHCKDKTQTKKLIDFLQQTAKQLGIPPLLITIDCEGGVVSRSNEAGGFISVPSPWKLAQTGLSECFSAGAIIGKQMHEVGMNVDFAPCLDLFDPKNPIMATRCFDQDPEKTFESAQAFASGLSSFNVLPVFKHFPGLGLAPVDSHTHKTVISATTEERNKHLQPFKKMATEFAEPFGIMCSHAIVPAWGNEPLTSNPFAVQFFQHLQNPNRPLLITDDFSMKGAAPDKTIEEAFIQSLLAGFDLIIYSANAQKQIAMLNTIENYVADLDFSVQQMLQQRAQRVQTFKQLFFSRKTTPPIFDTKQAASFLIKRCLQPQKIVPSLTDKEVIMLSINLPVLRPSEPWFCSNEHSYLYHQLTSLGLQPIEYLFNPKQQKSIKQAEQLLAAHPDAMIITQSFFFNTSDVKSNDLKNDIQKQLFALLNPYAQRTIAISLAHPVESSLLPQAYHFQLGSFNQPLLDHVAHLLTMQPPQTGADILFANPEKFLANKKIGLLCHRASFVHANDQWIHLVNALHAWTQDPEHNATLVALFGPEHGLFGQEEAGATVKSTTSSTWNCPIYSLYGQTKKPKPEWLSNLDVLIIDFQDVGVRCFTYMSTMINMIHAAQAANLPVLILDRPNPLSSWQSPALPLDKKYESFVGAMAVSFLHGLTPAQLVKKLFPAPNTPIILLPGNTTQDFFFEYPYIAPSPNLPSLDHVYAYPITVFFEGTNCSEGRGTHHSFLQIGAPWIDGKKLAHSLNALHMPGVYFQPTCFTPIPLAGRADNPKHCGKKCGGVFLYIIDPQQAKPISTAQIMLDTLNKQYPDSFQWIKSGSRYFIDLLAGGTSMRLPAK